MANIYKGRKVRISIGGKVIYHATECTVNIDSNTEDLATKDTQGNVVSPDGYSWNASTNALVAELPTGMTSTHSKFMDILDLQLNSTEVDFEFTRGDEDDFVLSGKAYVTAASITASVGSAVSGSFTFTGNGDLSKTVVV